MLKSLKNNSNDGQCILFNGICDSNKQSWITNNKLFYELASLRRKVKQSAMLQIFHILQTEIILN
jgi:hypothetical protein